MKKLALTVAGAALFVAPALASAQTSTASVTAEATIQASLTATKSADLRFGNVVVGQPATVASNAAPSTAATTGAGNIAISHNSNFSLSTSVPTALNHTTVANASLNVSFACQYIDDTGALQGAEFACKDAVGGTGNTAVGRFGAATVGTTQTTQLRIGGTLTPNAAMPLGTYRSALTFTFTAIN